MDDSFARQDAHARWAADAARSSRPERVAAYIQLPAGAIDEPVDPEAFASGQEARWNDDGQRTLYLASDVAVAVSEFARHLDAGQDDAVPAGAERDVWRLEVDLPAVVDLRASDVAHGLGVPDAPHCFLDAQLARDVARAIRTGTKVGALRTQPMAFLDAPERWNLVVFPEKLDGEWLVDARRIGRITLDDGPERGS